MYFLVDEACSPLTLTEKEYSWMVGQLRTKRSAELKKQWLNTLSLLELRALVKSVTKE